MVWLRQGADWRWAAKRTLNRRFRICVIYFKVLSSKRKAYPVFRLSTESGIKDLAEDFSMCNFRPAFVDMT
jgi:hypothetical protein